MTLQHFDEAFKRVQPSVSASDQRRYDELRRKLRRERGSLAPEKQGEKGGGGGGGGDGGKSGGGGGGGGLLEAGPAMAEDSGGSAGRVTNTGKGSGASSGKSKKRS